MKPERYLNIFVNTTNTSTAGNSISKKRIVEILEGEKPTKMEEIWLSRGLDESCPDVLVGMIWHLGVKPSRITELFKQCGVVRNDWDYD